MAKDSVNGAQRTVVMRAGLLAMGAVVFLVIMRASFRGALAS